MSGRAVTRASAVQRKTAETIDAEVIRNHRRKLRPSRRLLSAPTSNSTRCQSLVARETLNEQEIAEVAGLHASAEPSRCRDVAGQWRAEARPPLVRTRCASILASMTLPLEAFKISGSDGDPAMKNNQAFSHSTFLFGCNDTERRSSPQKASSLHARERLTTSILVALSYSFTPSETAIDGNSSSKPFARRPIANIRMSGL